MISRNEFRLMQDRLEPKPARNQRLEKALRGEEVKLESELHDQVEAFLRRNDIPYIHSRMDKPSTIRPGWPDFTAMKAGRVACVELKAPNGIVSNDQEIVIEELREAGVPIAVCSELMKAIKFLVAHLLEAK